MNKKKAVFVTVVMTIMLMLIDMCLYRLNRNGFIALTGFISVYGFYRCAADFCKWLAAPEKKPEQARFLNEPKPAGRKRSC